MKALKGEHDEQGLLEKPTTATRGRADVTPTGKYKGPF
jgi:hypothetical protein